MKCLRCQRDNATAQKYCGECGTPLTGASQAAPHADPKDDNERLRHLLAEAREQQAATSEILQVISSSPTDARPVFETIVASAGRLCGAESAVVYRLEGGAAYFAAHYNLGPETVEAYGRRFPRPLHQTDYLWRIADGSVLNSPDIEQDSRMSPPVRADYRSRGARSAVWVPMVREGQALGAISVTHRDIDAFSRERVQLLKTFADQAVIAIENARLFKELEARNRDLTVSLDRQTATADVLRIIAQSPSQLQPVLDAIAASAVRLLRARSGTLSRVVGDQIELAAHTSTDDAGDAATRAAFPQPLSFGGVHAQTIRNRAPLNIADAPTDPRLPEAAHTYAQIRGFRSQGAVPMLRHDEVVGAIAVARREAGGFTDDEIALLKTFADQAVIAIENVRLFTELQQINRDLHEALDHQTATSDILRVISAARTDVQPVFEAITASAVRLCNGDFGTVFVYDGTAVRPAAVYNASDRGVDQLRRVFGGAPTLETVTGRALLTREVVHRPDAQHAADVPGTVAMARAWPYGTIISVPLVREGQAIGTINVAKADTSPFSEKR